MHPYALLARLDRPVGIWLLLLPGWQALALAGGGIGLFILFGIGAVIMRAAGCVINDLWDRDLDRQVERTKLRPLASGALSKRQAAAFLLALLAVGLLILLQLNRATVFLGFLSMPLIAAYPLMKRITWWPQLFLGIVFNFGAPMGWSAVTDTLALPALLLYVGGVFWTLGYDTIYAHQDREDDLRVGVKSTAIFFGQKSRMWIAGFYLTAWLFFLSALLAAGAGFFSFFILSVAGLHPIRQIWTWDADDPASSLKIFRSNRDFGLLVLAAALV